MKKRATLLYILLADLLLTMSGSLFAMQTENVQPENQQPLNPAAAEFYNNTQDNMEIVECFWYNLVRDWIPVNLDNMIDAYSDSPMFISDILRDIHSQGIALPVLANRILDETRRRIVILQNNTNLCAKIEITPGNNDDFVVLNPGQRRIVRHKQQFGKMATMRVTLLSSNVQVPSSSKSLKLPLGGGERFEIGNGYHKPTIVVHRDLDFCLNHFPVNPVRRNLFG